MFQFEGQQSDERILYCIIPHVFAKYVAIARLIILSVIFFFTLYLISTVVPSFAGLLRTIGLLFSLILLVVGAWWNTMVFTKSKTFITDRRIIRFEVVSPFFLTKRVLFWNEALKAKAYTPNLLYRFLNIGTIQVEPHLSDHENVKVTDVFYFEDLANYIDKILFTFKNKPAEIVNLSPFVPKPKGQRS